MLIMYIFEKHILKILKRIFNWSKCLQEKSRVRIPPDADILDSIVGFIFTSFFEFSIKIYKYCEIFSQMENLLCEYISFGGVNTRIGLAQYKNIDYAHISRLKLAPQNVSFYLGM